jgi:lysophospholipase L1-like esterase
MAGFGFMPHNRALRPKNWREQLMMSSSHRLIVPRFGLLLLTAVVFAHPVVRATEPHMGRGWVGTWTASPQAASPPLQINGQTLRQIVRTSIGGGSARIRLSNLYGTQDVIVGAARVAVSAGGAAIVDGTDRVLRFGGSPTITISAGALVVSDPVRLDVPPLSDLAVSIYLPGDVIASTRHDAGLQTNYVSTPGDFTGATDFAGTTTQSFHFLTAVEVQAQKKARAVVTLGESVTDGVGSTPDTNQRWTNVLAERLQGHSGTEDIAVLNAGIGGNRILHDIVGPSGLSRLDRDVLVQSGATYLIVSPGNTDILIPDLIGIPAQNVSAEQIIQGHRQIITRARAMGLRVYGATLPPVDGFPFSGFWTPAMEEKRQLVNRFVRQSGAYDAVIDFDAVLRDPAQPTRLRPEYDSGDHVHPNDLGHRAMAEAIGLKLFRGKDY